MQAVHPVRVAAVGCIALALLFGVGSFELGFWVDGVPGPGLLPLAVSIALLPIGVRLFVAPSILGVIEPFRWPPLAALPLLAIEALAAPRWGFVIPTFVLLTVWIVGFHQKSFLGALLTSFVLTALCTVLFYVLLQVPVPLWPWSE